MPLGVSATMIEVLEKVFDQYFSGLGGALYQMAVTPEQASELSYLAGCQGLVRMFNGSYDVPQALQYLRQNNVSLQVFDYLQARLLLHLSLKVQQIQYRWKKELEEDRVLVKLLHSISYELLHKTKAKQNDQFS